MLKKLITYIVFILLLAGQGVMAQRGLYNRSAKTPYGLYVLSDQLKEIFPLATITNVPGTIFNSLKNKSHYRALYLVTVNNFSPVWPDLKALRDFADEGNNVLITANSLNETTTEFFDIQVKQPAKFYYRDSIRLLQTTIDDNRYFSSRVLGDMPWLTFSDSVNTKVLGTYSTNRPNLIRIKQGRGAVYFHILPEAFTNYFILDKQNYQYTEALLSYLPKNTGDILWKTGRTGTADYSGSTNEFGFLGFIWNDNNLRSAFLLALLAVVLLIIFGFKRRQRIIPVVTPVTNTTLEFAQTMGDLYFNQRSNTAIAQKKIQYWQEYVRNKYNIPTKSMDEEFWNLLSRKSGITGDQLRQLELYIVRARNEYDLKDRDLVYLNNSIDQFYKI